MDKIRFFGEDESVTAARGMDWGLVIEICVNGGTDIHQIGMSLESTRDLLAHCLEATDERLRMVDEKPSSVIACSKCGVQDELASYSPKDMMGERLFVCKECS